MDVVLRAASLYFALMVLFRLAGRRSLAEITPFDLILLLVIGEAPRKPYWAMTIPFPTACWRSARWWFSTSGCRCSSCAARGLSDGWMARRRCWSNMVARSGAHGGGAPPG